MTDIVKEAEDSPEKSQQLEIINANISDIYERCKVDINFFASLCIPSVCIYALPFYYIACFQLITQRDVSVQSVFRFALGLPRGHAKTTFIKVLICWFLCYDKAKFILIICADAKLAELLLADIHYIMGSPGIVSVYGDWEQGLSIDSADTKKNQYHGDSVSLVARGWSGGVRGINLHFQRPDLIFCDDAQTLANSESETESYTLLKTLTGSIFKSITPHGNPLILYVGNMYGGACILAQLKKSDSWHSMITGAILQDGKPLWPELHSLETLMESYYHDESLGMSHVWFAEVMNDPTNSAQSIFPNPLPDSPIEEFELEQADGAFITVDPAGFRKNSDANEIIVHLKFGEMSAVVDRASSHKDPTLTDPEQIILRTLALAVKWRCSLIGIEGTGYQQTLQFWVLKYIVKLGITDLAVVELSPANRAKEYRIKLYIAELYKKNCYIHDIETRRDFTWQASTYKMGVKTNRDDLLDACAYSLDVRNQYWDRIRLLDHGLTIDGECRVVTDNTPF